MSQHPLGDTGDVGNMVVDRSPTDAEPLCEFVAQGGLEHDAGGELRSVQGLTIEGTPATVGSTREVGDEDVSVELWVAGSACAMPESCCDEARAMQTSGAPPLERSGLGSPVVRASTDEAGLAFQPCQGISDGCVDCSGDLGADERIGERIQHRHRLRCRERQIEPRHPSLERADLRSVGRQSGPGREPGEDCPKVVAGDRLGKVEDLGSGAEPSTLGLPSAAVVVVDAARHL